MFSMKPNKSLGPDGILPVFLQKLWHVVGEEIGRAKKGPNDNCIIAHEMLNCVKK